MLRTDRLPRAARLWPLPALLVMSSVVLILSASVAAADPPNPIARVARLDLLADEAVGAIESGQSSASGVTVSRMNWMPEGSRDRGYSVQGTVTHFQWRDFEVSFTPKKSGEVQVTLMGEWKETAPGKRTVLEVDWDDVTATGTTLANGDFDGTGGWNGTRGGKFATAEAASGTHVGRTWHDAPLVQAIQVKAGVPVTIKAKVRATWPEGLVDMPRLGNKTPAHDLLQKFRKGVNFGNGFEVPPGQNWAQSYTAEDVANVAKEGFDHIRLPVGWHHYTGAAPDFTIDPAFFRKVDVLVAAARDKQLSLLINIHHFDEFTTDPAKETPRFLKLWEQIAKHYQNQPDTLAFELLNEPKDAATTEAINPIYADAIKIIRNTNPKRAIFVGPGRWNSTQELPSLRLPADDRLIVTLHMYDPFYFTHQGASWAGPDVMQLSGIRFPGPPKTPASIPESAPAHIKDWLKRYNTQPMATNPCSARVFTDVATTADAWGKYYGRPIHFGEFGAYEKADRESRVRYMHAARTEFEKVGAGWSLWDWKAGFKYWDADSNAPVPGMHEALLGP